MHRDHKRNRPVRYFAFGTAEGTPNEIARMRRQPLWVVIGLNIVLRELRFRFNQKRKSRMLCLEQCRLVQRRFGVLPKLFDFILEE